MAHVFISYSSRHRDLTRDFAARLEAEGFPVWWDRALEAWGDYEPQIREALGVAKAVVMIWSPGAAGSDFVRAEVRAALRLGRLVNLRAPDFPVDEVPLDFRENHMLPLDLADTGPILKTLRTVWEGRIPPGNTPAWVTYAEDHGESLFDAHRKPLPQDVAMVTPSVLLQAAYEVAPYDDATGLVADVMDWCRDAGAHAESVKRSLARAGRARQDAGDCRKGASSTWRGVARTYRDEAFGPLEERYGQTGNCQFWGLPNE